MLHVNYAFVLDYARCFYPGDGLMLSLFPSKESIVEGDYRRRALPHTLCTSISPRLKYWLQLCARAP
jgi:hypothetical protein